MTAALLLGVSMPSSPAAAKKKAPKLSTKKVSISVGQKKTIKLKNGKKAVWSIKSGKKVVSLSKKKKTSVVVKGKKAGKAVVLAKVGKKKLTCKVTVKAKKPAVTKHRQLPLHQTRINQVRHRQQHQPQHQPL